MPQVSSAAAKPRRGIAIGFIVYPILKLASERGRAASWLVRILGLIFLARYVFPPL